VALSSFQEKREWWIKLSMGWYYIDFKQKRKWWIKLSMGWYYIDRGISFLIKEKLCAYLCIEKEFVTLLLERSDKDFFVGKKSKGGSFPHAKSIKISNFVVVDMS